MIDTSLCSAAEPALSRRESYTRAGMGAPRQSLSVLAVDTRQQYLVDDRLDKRRFCSDPQPAIRVPIGCDERIDALGDQSNAYVERRQKRKYGDQNAGNSVLRVQYRSLTNRRDGLDVDRKCKRSERRDADDRAPTLSWLRESFERILCKVRTGSTTAGVLCWSENEKRAATQRSLGRAAYAAPTRSL